MALRVGLPLNGNLNNYGISDITVTNNGATVDNNGKIGKCYKFDGTYLTVSTGLPANPTIFSFCSWVKLISGYAVNNGCHLVALGNNCRICVSKDSAAIRFIGNNATVSCSSSVLSSNLIADVWYHVAVIFDNGNVRMYLNGVKVADSNIGATSLNLSNNMSTQVGSYSTELSKAYMNDFRIYDHALSEKEVKELAKGLVLHYRLAGPGQTNLTKGNNTYERNNASTDGWFGFSGSNFNCKPSTTYTLSIDIDGTISNFHGGNASTDPTKRWASMGFYLCKTGTSTNAANGGYDVPINLNSTNYNFRKIGSTRYAWTYTTPSDARSLSIRGNTYSNGTDSIKVKFWNPKIEEGSIATPGCPNSSDPLYSALGYNNNIEDDCSGYSNNGTKYGTITCKSGSPRYNSCLTFDAKSHIKIPKPMTVGNTSQFTVSMWVKPESGCGGYAIVASNYNYPANGFWMAINTEGSGTGFYNGAYAAGGSLLTVGTGHHIAMVFNAGIITGYTNGVATTTSNVSSRTTQFTDYIALGNSYTGTSWNTNFVGCISDFRIYATALSADDIKQLYSSPISIDKVGNLFASEFKEI